MFSPLFFITLKKREEAAQTGDTEKRGKTLPKFGDWGFLEFLID